MRTLSFDIGIKNLAYCYTDGGAIVHWDVVDISDKTVNGVCERCIRTLHERFGEIRFIDRVLIENQPVQKNPTMKTIQIVVFSYFLRAKALDGTVGNIHFVSAGKKNKLAERFGFEVETKSKYTRAKKLSVLSVKHILENDPAISSWTDHFVKHKKKDDLADAYLQLLAHANYTPVLPNPPSPRLVESNETTSTTSGTEMLVTTS